MEALFTLLMILGYLFDERYNPDDIKHPCNKPYICKEAKPNTPACLKEAMDFQMENCLRR